MDKFKENQSHYVGVGGLHCQCCNWAIGKKKKMLNKLARSRFKRNLLKEILNY